MGELGRVPLGVLNGLGAGRAGGLGLQATQSVGGGGAGAGFPGHPEGN